MYILNTNNKHFIDMIYFLGHNKWSNIRHVKAAKDLIKNKELLLNFLQLLSSQRYTDGVKVFGEKLCALSQMIMIVADLQNTSPFLFIDFYINVFFDRLS